MGDDTIDLSSANVSIISVVYPWYSKSCRYLGNLRVLPPSSDPEHSNAFYAKKKKKAIGGEDQLLGGHHIGRHGVGVAEDELDGSQRQEQRDNGCKRRHKEASCQCSSFK